MSREGLCATEWCTIDNIRDKLNDMLEYAVPPYSLLRNLTLVYFKIRERKNEMATRSSGNFKILIEIQPLAEFVKYFEQQIYHILLGAYHYYHKASKVLS